MSFILELSSIAFILELSSTPDLYNSRSEIRDWVLAFCAYTWGTYKQTLLLQKWNPVIYCPFIMINEKVNAGSFSYTSGLSPHTLEDWVLVH